MQPEQRCVTAIESAISSLYLALSSPSVMAALASWPKPAMALGWALRNGARLSLMSRIRSL
ncbi:hypothetical protein FQZ97_1098360 [compost metagenome]